MMRGQSATHHGLRPGTVWGTLGVVLILGSGAVVAEVIDFNSWELAPDLFWSGPVAPDRGAEQPGPYGGVERVGVFNVDGLQLVNRFNLDFNSWSGFAVSELADVLQPGIANQGSSFAQGGAEGKPDNFAIGFGYLDDLNPQQPEQLLSLPYIEIPVGRKVESAFVTNTTYAAQSMLQGDRFAKRFGGPSGSDPDFFRLSVYGTDDQDHLLESVVERYLADFRFADDTQDFVLDEWARLDLSPLSDARRLFFNLESSDNSFAGMLTPAYFAIDNISLLSELVGDFDTDGILDGLDLDLLCTHLSFDTVDVRFDLNLDGQWDASDLEVILGQLGVRRGDVDLDGYVQFSDFLKLSASFGNAGTWSDGDFSCDGDVGFADFLVLSQNFGVPMPAVSVPEVHTGTFCAVVFCLLVIRSPRRSTSAK